jgi:hypothetical protein
MAVTDFVVLPLTQVIVDFAGTLGATGAVVACAAGVALGEALGDGVATGAGAS